MKPPQLRPWQELITLCANDEAAKTTLTLLGKDMDEEMSFFRAKTLDDGTACVIRVRVKYIPFAAAPIYSQVMDSEALLDMLHWSARILK